MSTFEALECSLALTEYARARLQPQVQDIIYLHLHDLLLAVEEIKTDEPLTLLDYGCGSSPYRSLFPRADYRRADFLEMDRLDYRLGADSRVPEKDGVFDLVLSTQVLEHVPEPQIYLSECFRLLKPGGKIFLTTHGVYPDHGCPYDFQRWTGDGLKFALEQAGFREVKVQRLTTGLRALVFLLEHHLLYFTPPNTSWKGFSLACGRRFLNLFRAQIHRLCDFCFADCQKVAEPTPEHILYIALAIEARR
jgi:SAM-dependent methyltransferase